MKPELDYDLKKGHPGILLERGNMEGEKYIQNIRAFLNFVDQWVGFKGEWIE